MSDVHVADFLLRCFITCGSPPAALPQAAVHSRDAAKLLKVLHYFRKSSASPNLPHKLEAGTSQVQRSSRMDIYLVVTGNGGKSFYRKPLI